MILSFIWDPTYSKNYLEPLLAIVPRLSIISYFVIPIPESCNKLFDIPQWWLYASIHLDLFWFLDQLELVHPFKWPKIFVFLMHLMHLRVTLSRIHPYQCRLTWPQCQVIFWFQPWIHVFLIWHYKICMQDDWYSTSSWIACSKTLLRDEWHFFS